MPAARFLQHQVQLLHSHFWTDYSFRETLTTGHNKTFAYCGSFDVGNLRTLQRYRALYKRHSRIPIGYTGANVVHRAGPADPRLGSGAIAGEVGR